MLAKPSIIAALLLAALTLNCAGRAEMALVDPSKYQFYNCPQLEKAMKTLSERAQELRSLNAKAGSDSTSAMIARISYQDDYLTTTGDMQLVEAAGRDRDCSPPIAPAGATAAR